MTTTVDHIDAGYAKARAALNSVAAAADHAEQLECKAEAALLNEALGNVTKALIRYLERLDRSRLHPED